MLRRSSRTRHSLTSIPTELLHNIARKTQEDEPGPPHALFNLLLTCRHTYAHLSFDHNPTFYADLFDTDFDTDALKRRFDGERLTAASRADEYKRRWTLLKEIKTIVALSSLPDDQIGRAIWGDPATGLQGTYTYDEKLQHAWLAYMMLTESDGYNWEQLQWANIVPWIYRFMCYDIDRISEGAQQTGLLPESNELRSLGMWIWWLTLQYEDIVLETPLALSKVNRMLRPFAFASFGYSFFFAPWTSRQLPDTDVHTTIAEGTLGGPLSFDPRPTNTTTTTLHHYLGSPLLLTPPHICHAASLLFFSRMQRYPLGQMECLPHDLNDMNMFRNEHFDDYEPYTPKHATINFPAVAESERYDEDVMRLVWCRDPTRGTLPGKRPRWAYKPGSYVGEWEGRFVNYGILGYQAVGEGAPPLHALESEPLRQDPQAWRIHEFHHPSTLRGRLLRQYHRFLRQTYTTAHHTAEPWAPHSHKRPPVKHVGVLRGLYNGFVPPSLKRVPVHGGVEVTERGAGRLPIFYVEVRRDVRTGRTFVGEFVEDEDEEDGDEEGEGKEGAVEDSASDDIDIIVEGKAIPRVHVFPYESVSMMEVDSVVYGTIRRWDGLIHLHAIPLHGPNSAGQWLYRGYLTSNGNWIGRSRDTWTSDVHREGYEGVFVMTRRGG